MKHYTKDKLPATGWQNYTKKTLTMAVKISEPFKVMTREGDLVCQEGFLAIDAHGWPYPIASEEFMAIYEPVSVADTTLTEGG